MYFHFDRAATDPVLQNLEDQFKKEGLVIEAVRSTGHIRLPMSRKYSVYGIYSAKKASLIKTMAFDELLTLWKNYNRFAYLDPSLEMDLDHNQYQKKFSPRKKRVAQINIKQRLLDNPKLDYRAGERKEVQTSILSYCIRYGLPLQDFMEICEAHDHGARGKTDYKSFYEWGQNHFEHSDSRKVFGNINYEDIIDRVERYSKTTELSETLDRVLKQKISDRLIPFLSKRSNVSKGGFKNENLIKERYYQRAKQFLLFLIRYEEARNEEWRLCWSNDPRFKLPMVFVSELVNGRDGMPLPLSLIKFLGKSFKCKSFPEIKSFLEKIGLLKAIELKPGVTYAPGTCIYYETDRIMELQGGESMTDEESVIASLRDPAHSFPVPDSLVRKWGLEKALFFGYLLKKSKQSGNKRFRLTIQDVLSETRINDYKQRKVLKQLASMGDLTIYYVSRERFIEIKKYPPDLRRFLKR